MPSRPPTTAILCVRYADAIVSIYPSATGRGFVVRRDSVGPNGMPAHSSFKRPHQIASIISDLDDACNAGNATLISMDGPVSADRPLRYSAAPGGDGHFDVYLDGVPTGDVICRDDADRTQLPMYSVLGVPGTFYRIHEVLDALEQQETPDAPTRP